jgi:DNA-binding NarL/FixJ family response regulator
MFIVRRMRASTRPKAGAHRGPEVHTIIVGGETLAILSFPVASAADRVELTPAERAIADALLRGESNAEIARHRRTSPRTVANQVAALFQKLGVSSRRELVARMTLGGENPGENDD